LTIEGGDRKVRGGVKTFGNRLAVAAALATSLVATGASAACTINASNTVAFGAYDINSATANDSAGTITYTCTSFALVTLGTGASGTFTARTMIAGGPDLLSYNLYRDAARTQVFGDWSGGTSGTFVGAGTNATISVYGRVPALQNVAPGAYTDSVVVTFTF
jgi:spore coat protein U-like protein